MASVMTFNSKRMGFGLTLTDLRAPACWLASVAAIVSVCSFLDIWLTISSVVPEAATELGIVAVLGVLELIRGNYFGKDVSVVPKASKKQKAAGDKPPAQATISRSAAAPKVTPMVGGLAGRLQGAATREILRKPRRS